jgi:type IV pilus assembly protein PilE
MNLFSQKIHSNGFHLIEIIIVVAIISILSAISVPIYTQYTTHARRAEAVSALMELSIALEHFHLEHNTYEEASLLVLNFPEDIADHHYRLIIQTTTSHEYALHAEPRGKQAENDAICGTLILDSNNRKNITGTGNIHECWQSLL